MPPPIGSTTAPIPPTTIFSAPSMAFLSWSLAPQAFATQPIPLFVAPPIILNQHMTIVSFLPEWIWLFNASLLCFLASEPRFVLSIEDGLRNRPTQQVLSDCERKNGEKCV